MTTFLKPIGLLNICANLENLWIVPSAEFTTRFVDFH